MPIVKHRQERLQHIDMRLNRWGGHPVTTDELARSLAVSASTIKQDIDYLKDELLAPIAYSRNPKGYHYTRPFQLAASITLTPTDMAALHTAVATLQQYQHLSLFNDLQGTVDKVDKAVRFRTSQTHNLGKYILFESVPYVKGSQWMDILLQAIEAGQAVTFQHQRFDTEVIKSHRLLPYLLKEHRNRWYVVGWQLDYGQVRVFGLDRIVDDSIQLTSDTCLPPPFDADAYFRKALGVAVYDEPPQEVVLSFSRKQGLHFRAQPFYPFREEDVLIDTENEFRVRLSIIINEELVYELARFGASVKVVSPPALWEQLAQHHRQAFLLYS